MAQKSILSFFKAPTSNTQKAAKSTISCSSKRKSSTDEEKLQKSPVKAQDKQVEQKSDAEIDQPELNKTNCQKSDIDAEKNEKKVEVIPRRNTARKQMRSTSKLKKEVNTKSKPKNSPKTTKNNIKTENLPNEPEIKETDGIEDNLGVSENGICDSVKQERNDFHSNKQKIGNNSVSTEKLVTDESSNNNGKTLDDINNNTDDVIKKGKKRKKNVISDDSPVKNSEETANKKKEKISVPTDDSEKNELSGDTREIIDDVSNDENEITKKVKKRKKNVILDDSPVKISEGNADREINANVESKTDIKKEFHCVENKKQKIEDLAVTDDSKMDHSGANQEINDEIIQKVKKRKKNIITDDSPVKSNKTDSDLCNLPNETENEVYANAESKASEKKEVKSSTEKKAVHSFFAPKKTSTAKQSNSNVVADDKSKKAAKNISLPSTKDKEIYNPAKHHYHPIDDACWKKGEKVPYLALARTLEEVENISARLKMIEILANYFRSVITLTPEDLLHSVYLCLNRIAPEYEGIEMSVGETLLMKAVAQATGRTMEKIKAEVAIKGDLGLVAESSRGNQRVMFAPPKLTVSSVFSKFKEIAMMSGNAVMSKKVDKIQALFVACRHCEARYIIRSLTGKLRIGLAEQSVLAALSQAAVLTPPNQSYPPEIMNASSKHSTDSFKKILEANTLILKTTYCECPNYDMLIPILLKEGISGLPEHCRLTPGMPLKPMLAHPTKGIEEVLRRFDTNEFTCEFKYDGERAQIHVMENGEGKIYSRNQEDNTSKYPDVLSRLSKALKPETKSCILDTEAVAWDRESNQILPFQVLSTRKRKDAVESEITVQVCVVAFDLLYLNGESLIKKPLKERRELLLSSFIEVPNEFKFAQSTDGNSAETMQVFLEESIKGNCEGLMVKSLEVDATYEIAKRSHNWLKLKKDYLDGIGDTLDLVVIGGFHGKGKRTGNYGGFLLACYDDENEEFQTICKIGTGFKEEDLENHTKFFKEHVITEAKSYFRFDNNLEPDDWFEPVQVWEVKCADLSISPVHKAALGIVDSEKGISLRFPRFLRIREDKKTEEATTASQVAQMYNSQEQVQNQKQKDGKIEDEDFY